VCVSGSFDTYKRLCGIKDKRFTQTAGTREGVDKARVLHGTGSIRGFTQLLQGGVKLRRMRKHVGTASGAQVDTGSWWVCIDYSKTHPHRCKSNPKCTSRCGKVAAFTNPTCLGITGLILERQAGNTHDANAIAVVPSGGGRRLVDVVGYVPRELAMCLAPALDAGVVVISGMGIFSDQEIETEAVSGANAEGTSKDTASKLLIWFRVDRVEGFTSISSNPGEILIEKALRAMQRWVPDTEVGSSSNPVER